MKTWHQTISLSPNDEHKIVAHGYPDLRVDCVLGGSVEGLDVQMLLDPFEELMRSCTKWIKQHLRIKKFWVNSKNDVRIQAYSPSSAIA